MFTRFRTCGYRKSQSFVTVLSREASETLGFLSETQEAAQKRTYFVDYLNLKMSAASAGLRG
jgi:hypothetical protein